MKLRCQTRMQKAIEQDDLEMVKHLVEVKRFKFNNDYYIDLATELGHLEITAYLDSFLPEWWYEERCFKGEERLIVAFPIAAEHGHLHFFRFWDNEDPDLFDGKNWGMDEASEHGHFEIVKFLYEKCHTFPTSCLYDAIRHENIEWMQYLYDNRFSFHFNDNDDNEEAYNHAIWSGSLDVLLFLYKFGSLFEHPKLQAATRTKLNMKRWRQTVNWMNKVRPYAWHWYQVYQEATCAPNGKGRKRDRDEFIKEFCH